MTAETKASGRTAEPTECLPDASRIIVLLEEAREDRRRIEAEMNRAFEFVHSSIGDQKELINAQNQKITEYLKIIEELREENAAIKKKNIDLENRVVESEQYLRSNTLEIQGIPESNTEDVYEIVQNVGKALDIEISRQAIDVCHRLGKRRDSQQPAGIIAKFVRREDKQKFLEKRRVKRNLSTKDVGYQQAASPVYINESLCPAIRKLYAAARQAKRDKNFTFIWIRNGKIFMRKNPGDPVIVISCMADIERLS